MAKITKVIQPDNIEFVRDRIAAVLIEELGNQAQLTYDLHLDPQVTLENTNAEDIVNMALVNISVAAGTYDNKDYRSVKGTYTFFIDCYTKAKTTQQIPGNYLAAQRLQKLMRLCRAILNDPIYKTLGFQPGFIYRVYLSGFDIRNMPGKNDTNNSAMGRLTLVVEATENDNLITPKLIEGYETKLNIGNSSAGYFWDGENYQ